MQDQATHASGHAFCVERKRGPQWYANSRRRQASAEAPRPCLDRRRPAAGRLLHEEDRRGGTGRDPHRRSPWCSSRPSRGRRDSSRRDRGVAAPRQCERGIKASTASEYRNVVEAHIVPRFGNWPVRSTKRRSAMRLLSVHRRRPIRSVLARSGKSKSAVRRRRPSHLGLFQPDPWRRDDEELRLHGIRGRGPPPEGHILARTNGG